MRYLLLCCFLFLFVKGHSQSLLDSIGSTDFMIQETIAEKLADLAVTSNRVKVAEKNMEVLTSEIKKSQASWLNVFSGSYNHVLYNLNNPFKSQASQFFPKYNAGVNIPLDFFFTQMSNNKIARVNYEKSVFLKDQEISDMRKLIKIQCQTYQANLYLLSLQESMLQDEKILLDNVSNLFDNNQANLQAFTDATRRYNMELVKKINLIKEVNSSKFELEALLGMKLSEALRKIRVARF
jgi:outer membrane protein TolC